MFELNDKDLFKALYSNMKKYNKSAIFLWGASVFLENFLEEFKDLNEFNILGIIDKNPDKHGKFLKNYQMFSPEELKKPQDVTVIMTVKNNAHFIFKEISSYIHKLENNINLAPNIFDEFINDNLAESLSSNQLFLVNSKGEKKAVSYIKGLNIEWLGENSVVEIGANPIPRFENTSIICKSNCKISIGSSIHYIKNLSVKTIANNFSLSIGKDFSSEGVAILLNEPKLTVTIGDECMFSTDIMLRPSDGHTIFDENNNIINRGKSINVGNKVWIGQGVSLLKNSSIANNTVVGLGSVVTQDFNEESVIIAGVPAKIIKRNITWSRERING